MPPRYDFTGQIFGRLTVQRFAAVRNGTSYWSCKCACGKTKIAQGVSLKRGTTVSCGCAHVKEFKKSVWGELTVLGLGDRTSDGRARWWCRCSCGVKSLVIGSNIKRGKTRSCGCRQGRRFEDPLRSTVNMVINAYQAEAKKRKRPWRLSYADCLRLFKGMCAYCGQEPMNRASLRLKTPTVFVYNGIDRIDSRRGYTVGNVTTCCIVCNQAKNDQMLSEFQMWLVRAVKHQRLI